MTRPQISPMQAAWLSEIGMDASVLALMRRDTARARAAAPAPVDAPAPAPLAPPAKVPPAPSVTSLDALDEAIAACQKCRLGQERDRAVPGEGQRHQPEWLIIGGVPSREDDGSGLPFQGDAGLLLQSMLLALGLHLESAPFALSPATRRAGTQPTSVFFTHMMKCRPLGSRALAGPEIAACRPWLEQQVRLLQPGRILAMGEIAAAGVLGSREPLDRLRGRVHLLDFEEARAVPVVVTWHPAALFLDPVKKRQAWADLQLAQEAARHQGLRSRFSAVP